MGSEYLAAGLAPRLDSGKVTTMISVPVNPLEEKGT